MQGPLHEAGWGQGRCMFTTGLFGGLCTQTLANCPEGPRKTREADFAAPEKNGPRGGASQALPRFAGLRQPWQPEKAGTVLGKPPPGADLRHGGPVEQASFPR